MRDGKLPGLVPCCTVGTREGRWQAGDSEERTQSRMSQGALVGIWREDRKVWGFKIPVI